MGDGNIGVISLAKAANGGAKVQGRAKGQGRTVQDHLPPVATVLREMQRIAEPPGLQVRGGLELAHQGGHAVRPQFARADNVARQNGNVIGQRGHGIHIRMR